MNDGVSSNDIMDEVPVVEDSPDVSTSDPSVSDWWLDPIDVSGSDVSGTDTGGSGEPGTTILEVDLEPIQHELESINQYLNILIGTLFVYGVIVFVRRIVFKINTKGKGIS